MRLLHRALGGAVCVEDLPLSSDKDAAMRGGLLAENGPPIASADTSELPAVAPTTVLLRADGSLGASGALQPVARPTAAALDFITQGPALLALIGIRTLNLTAGFPWEPRTVSTYVRTDYRIRLKRHSSTGAIRAYP